MLDDRDATWRARSATLIVADRREEAMGGDSLKSSDHRATASIGLFGDWNGVDGFLEE